MTVAGRLVRYLSVIALINMSSRPKLINMQTGRTWIIPNYKDLKKALQLMESVASEVRPYIAHWYNSVFKPAYDSLTEPDFKLLYKKNQDGQEYEERITEDRIALTPDQLKVKTSQVLGIPKPGSEELLNKYLYPLLNQGIIDKIPSATDKRAKIYFPSDEDRSLSSLFANSDDIRLQLKNPAVYPSKEVMKQVIDSILELDIPKNTKENTITDTLEKMKIYKIIDTDGEELTAHEVVDKYLSNPEICFRYSSDREEEKN